VKRALETPERAAAARVADLSTHDSRSTLRDQLAQTVHLDCTSSTTSCQYPYRLLELLVSPTAGITYPTSLSRASISDIWPDHDRRADRDIRVNSTYE
jgi:hypothetical protein